MADRNKNESRFGGSRRVILAAVALASVGSVAALTAPSLSFSSSIAMKKRDGGPLNPQELRGVLMRIGLDATSLAAAGLSAEEAVAVVVNARTHLQSAIQDVRDADEAYQVAKRQFTLAEQAVQQGQASPEQAGLSAAIAALAAADAERTNVLALVFEAATEEITQEQRTMLTTANANVARDIATQYLVVNRADDAWVHLRDALDHVRVTGQAGEEPSQDWVQVVNAANANPAVAAAAVNITNNGPTVTLAWETETLR